MSDILFINRLLMIFMIESLSINDQITLMFFTHVIINIDAMSSSSFKVLVVIASAFIIASFIAFLVDDFLILYLEIDDCKFHANFFLNC